MEKWKQNQLLGWFTCSHHYNIHEKIMCFKCILHVTQVQCCKSSANYELHSQALSKFLLSWPPVMLFSCKLLTSNNMISSVIWCKYAPKTTNCTHLISSCDFFFVFEKCTCVNKHIETNCIWNNFITYAYWQRGLWKQEHWQVNI